MKNFYKIHEIAELFHLHPDTLRYYEEKGIISPIRNSSGYRLYSFQDICTLNVIQSLRDLDISLDEIRLYLQKRSTHETLLFLQHEEWILQEKMKRLQKLKSEIENRENRLKHFQSISENQVKIIIMEALPYVFLQENIILEKEVDFLLKKLESKHQNYIKVIGSQTMGAFCDLKSLEKGIYNHFSSVFFLTSFKMPYDAVLPQGYYAQMFYKGSYNRLKKHLSKMKEEIRIQGFMPTGGPFELYHIDAHDTNIEDEYITELRIPVQAIKK